MSGNALEVTITPFEQQHIGLTTSSAYLEYALRATEGFFVLKGGSFDGALDSVRLATRKRTELSWAFEDMGFRVLRQLE